MVMKKKDNEKSGQNGDNNRSDNIENGENDEPNFSDPEGFVDDITDEGNNSVFVVACVGR